MNDKGCEVEPNPFRDEEKRFTRQPPPLRLSYPVLVLAKRDIVPAKGWYEPRFTFEMRTFRQTKCVQADCTGVTKALYKEEGRDNDRS